MRDREVVAAIVAGDPAGLAAAYDRDAAALYAYCHSLLREPADAADAVQDTFVVAASSLARLRDPGCFRSWLYAVARNECRRRLRARGSDTGLDAAGDMPDDSVDAGVGAERAELRELVRAAIAGLNPGQREVIELKLRHELDGAELADVLGIPRNQAHALVSRARDQMEKSLGALLVARSGRKSCPDLSALLAGWDGQLTVLLRKRVNRHIEHCDVCGDRQRRELRPAMLFTLVPIVALPPGLRRQVLRLVADSGPAAVAHRARVAERAEPFAGSGFPLPLDPPGPARMQARRVQAGAAALVLFIALGVFAASALHRGTSPVGATVNTSGQPPTAPASSTVPAATPLASTRPRSTPSPSPPAALPFVPATTHAPAKTARPSPAKPSPSATKPSRSQSPSPTPTGSPSSSPTPSPSPSGSATTPPPGSVTLMLPVLGELSTTVIFP